LEKSVAESQRDHLQRLHDISYIFTKSIMFGRVATTALALASLAAALPQASAAVNSESPQPNVNTATATASVYAAQKTAATYKGSPSYVGGQVFDRFVNIWFENTDYSKAAADPNFQWLASQGISLTNFYGVTHPSQPNYIAAVGGDNFGMDNVCIDRTPIALSGPI
jgi:hypothetical protein